MDTVITIGISDMKIAKKPEILATYALGSCVGICLYDVILKSGSLGHILLPLSGGAQNINKYKFADTCIPEMIKGMEKLGSNKRNLTAKIAGGASMFEISGDSTIGNIGKRNVEAVKNTLMQFQIKIIAEDVGLNYGRTVFFHLNDGSVQVKSFAKDIKIL